VALAAPPAEVSNGELIRSAFEALNRRDLAALREMYTEETVEMFPDRTCPWSRGDRPPILPKHSCVPVKRHRTNTSSPRSAMAHFSAWRRRGNVLRSMA
jgi:ketosteroid isomerase-like protein